MRGKCRVAGFILTIITMLTFVTVRAPLLAAPAEQPGFTGLAQIDGPLQVAASVSPPITTPGAEVTLRLELTNPLPHSASPEVILALPSSLSSASNRYPPATTFNFQSNRLSWQPVVEGNGGVAETSYSFKVGVADLTRPEQAINVILNYDGNEYATVVTFWSGLPPSALISVEPPVVSVGQPVALTAMVNGSGPITQRWNLGDGREISSKDPVVVYGSPGIYDLQLKVSNPLGAATALSAVTVVSEPTAAFSISDDVVTTGQAVYFTNQSGGERPLSFNWDFGDGATSTEPNPSHQYSAPGRYEVHLTVSSQYGQAQLTLPVTVGAAPVADFVLPAETVTGQPIDLQAFTDDTVNSLQWDMGDGRLYNGELIRHTYHQPGDYQVTLVAGNEYGESTIVHSIRVGAGIFSHYVPLLAVGSNGNEPLPTTIAPPIDPGLIQENPPPAEPTSPDSSAAPDALPQPMPGQSVSPGGASASPGGGDFQPVTLPPQSPLPENASPSEQLLWYINEARRLHGLPPLDYSYELTVAAQHHSLDMAQHPEVMHEGSDGSRPIERQQRYGYRGIYGGEAVAWGWESPIPVVEFWVNSPPHRVLILNPNAREVGIGFYADGAAPNIWYWTAEFGIRLEEPEPILP